MTSPGCFFDPVGMGRRPAKSHENPRIGRRKRLPHKVRAPALCGAGAFACQTVGFRWFFDPVIQPALDHRHRSLASANPAFAGLSGESRQTTKNDGLSHVKSCPGAPAFFREMQKPQARGSRRRLPSSAPDGACGPPFGGCGVHNPAGFATESSRRPPPRHTPTPARQVDGREPQTLQ
jgi:hypothetical protein